MGDMVKIFLEKDYRIRLNVYVLVLIVLKYFMYNVL